MTNLTNLDRVAHKNIRVNEERAFSVCKDITMCAVSPTEVPRLVLEYPVVFTQHSESKQFLLVALFGVDPQRNLFWRDDKWQSVTVPLNVARQPLFVGVGANPGEAGKGQTLVTCIDMDNPGVQESIGELLFDAEGKETPYLQRKLALLAELMDGEQRARSFIERAEALGLIRPIHLELTETGGAPRQIGGLYSVDEAKLRALPVEAISELNAKGYLHVMHAMLLSLGQFSILARRIPKE